MEKNNINQPLPDDLYDDDFIDDIDDDDEEFEDDDEELTEEQARRVLESPASVFRRPGRFAPTTTQRVASAADLIARADERRNVVRANRSPRQRERAELREKAKSYRPPASELQNVVRVPDLLFNVSQLLKENEGAHRDYDVEADTLPLELPDEPGAAFDPDAPVAHDIRGHIRFTRVRKDILAEGSFTAEISVPCSRCLEPALIPVEADIEEQFRPSIDVFTGVQVFFDTPDDEADLKIDQNQPPELG